MTTKMKMILAGACLALLAGCGGGGGGGAGPVAGPGVVLPPGDGDGNGGIGVRSADADANTVRVTDELATITVNSFDVEAETFSVTLGLPDGGSVTITELDISDTPTGIEFGDGRGKRFSFLNEDGDIVEVVFGLELDAVGDQDNGAELIDQSLFALVSVDPTGDADFGIDTYMVLGDETGTLPAEGSATYSGASFFSIYVDGELEGSSNTIGTVEIEAFFETSLVDILDLSGAAGDVSYILTGSDLPIDGSSYGGDLEGFVNVDEVELTGDLLGAFFGEVAEATAGVFGVDGTEGEVTVEIVGSFGAYIPEE